MPGASAGPGFAVRPPRTPAPGALPVEFYRRPVLEVARALIGCVVEHRAAAGMIVETEAYHESEPACHAYIGLTPRTRTLFGGPGRAYVYRSYGIHALLNAVCEEQGVGAAVLIRALEPLRGIAPHARASRAAPPRGALLGPGQAHRGARRRAAAQRLRPHPRAGHDPPAARVVAAQSRPRCSTAPASGSPRRSSCPGASASPATRTSRARGPARLKPQDPAGSASDVERSAPPRRMRLTR